MTEAQHLDLEGDTASDNLEDVGNCPSSDSLEA